MRAEKEKTREAKTTQRQIHREKTRSATSSNLKTGAMIGGVVGVGAVMMLTQMVTLGLLTLSTAGGAALGYGVRARQDRLGRGARNLLGRGAGEKEVRVIESKPLPKAVEHQRKPARDITDV